MRVSTGLDSWYRAAELLDLLRSEQPLGVSALSERLGLPKSTAARYLSVLQDIGFVQQAHGDDRYSLGAALYVLGRAVAVGALVRTAARPLMTALTEALGETTMLVVVDGREALCIEKIESAHAMRLTAQVGQRVPLHCGSSPRCLLAFLPAAEREDYLARPLAALSTGTVTDPDTLRTAAAETRARGYIVTHGEIDAGMVSVAAPMRDPQGAVVAALSLAGPEFRLTPERIPLVIARVQETARAIGAAWQHPGVVAQPAAVAG